MRTAHKFLTVCALALAAHLPAAWAAGNGPMSMPSSSAGTQMSPEIQARVFYNSGVKDVRKADDLQASAATLADDAKKTRALNDAQKLYSSALGKFQHSVQLFPRTPEAWNYFGYTSRKLGNYENALQAYQNALTLHPGFPEAIEYRGEAYLAVNRVADAQQSYLELFATNRALAGKLLEAMKSWIATQRSASAAGDLTAVNDLDKWVEERTQIAAQTASLTREGTAASWK